MREPCAGAAPARGRGQRTRHACASHKLVVARQHRNSVLSCAQTRTPGVRKVFRFVAVCVFAHKTITGTRTTPRPAGQVSKQEPLSLGKVSAPSVRCGAVALTHALARSWAGARHAVTDKKTGCPMSPHTRITIRRASVVERCRDDAFIGARRRNLLRSGVGRNSPELVRVSMVYQGTTIRLRLTCGLGFATIHPRFWPRAFRFRVCEARVPVFFIEYGNLVNSTSQPRAGCTIGATLHTTVSLCPPPSSIMPTGPHEPYTHDAPQPLNPTATFTASQQAWRQIPEIRPKNAKKSPWTRAPSAVRRAFRFWVRG